MASSRTWIATTIVGAVTSLWLYRQNRSLREDLAAKTEPAKTEQVAPQKAAVLPPRSMPIRSVQLPSLPIGGPSDQTRLDKRAAKQEELSTMFGRTEGESDEDYRKRVMPLLSAALLMPRRHITEMRRLAEEKAHVTPEQDQQIDASFQQIYNNVLAYANKAIADGTVSPYERNVASWLEFGGGLGSILEDANSQVARILSTDQMHAMYETGFEWGEYLGLEAPWESLQSAATEALITMPEPVIELVGLTRRFGSVVALDEVNARVFGRVIGLLGPNGAGKSTLLKCLLGVLPFEGSANVLGLSAALHGAQIRDRVGYLPEQDATMLGLDAVQLCSYVAELSGLPSAEAIQRAHAALDHVNFDDKRYQRVDNYSTGQKQRVKLAQALVHAPELLFLDEPTSGLDPRARDEMLALVGDLPRRCGCVVVLSTHLLPDVDKICDHAVIMHSGHVKFVGSVDDLRRTTRAFAIEVGLGLGAQHAADALSSRGATCRVLSATRLAVEFPGDATTSWLFDVAHELGIQIRGLEIERETIEAAFLRVIDPRRAGAHA